MSKTGSLEIQTSLVFQVFQGHHLIMLWNGCFSIRQPAAPQHQSCSCATIMIYLWPSILLYPFDWWPPSIRRILTTRNAIKPIKAGLVRPCHLFHGFRSWRDKGWALVSLNSFWGQSTNRVLYTLVHIHYIPNTKDNMLNIFEYAVYIEPYTPLNHYPFDACWSPKESGSPSSNLRRLGILIWTHCYVIQIVYASGWTSYIFLPTQHGGMSLKDSRIVKPREWVGVPPSRCFALHPDIFTPWAILQATLKDLWIQFQETFLEGNRDVSSWPSSCWWSSW